MPITVYHPRYQALREGLVALRKKAGLSQVQLAERLGVGQSFVSKIERGESYVDVMLFVDWCQACDTPSAGQELDALTGL
ncbi:MULTISPECIES: helix-turn-helix transcriptional regulator [Acidovorax]|uniref:helix-turn-helix domain-containing protein n=1 Tax=Acidovorax TaxID=12916 RepID=UPI00258DAFE9|nr:helix-turn-helix transcriptional regulator [Acidovorax sp.]